MNTMRGAPDARWALLLGAAALLAGATAVSALQEEDEPPGNGEARPVDFPQGVGEVDRIIAIVGDTAILKSELDVTFFQLRSQGARIPPEDTPEWRRFAGQVVSAKIDELLVIQHAKRQGLTPDPARVESMSEQFYQEARRGFASDEQLMQAVEGSGMNMLQYRQMLRAQAEAEALKAEFRFSLQQRTDLPPVVVTESELQAYFEERASEESRPPLVSYNQLVVTPSPSGAARDSALARVRRVQADLAAGEAFEVLARRHSDDAATRENGGELGWMRRDIVVRPFGDAVWTSRPGQTVGPVQTRFGIHFIKIERARGTERFLRHILIRPELSESDREEAREVATQIADSLRAGVDPERLAATFRGRVADEDIRYDEVPLEQLLGRLPEEGASALESPATGRVYGPYPLEQGGPIEYAVLQVVGFRPAGPLELDDVREQVREQVRLSKQLDLLLAEMRANTFIDIKL